MIELGVSKAECQILERLLRCLRSAEAARQALAKLAFCVAARDATERRWAKASLRENESKFRAMADTTTSAVFVYQDEQLCYVNPATEQITGYMQAELCTMDLWDLVDPDLLFHANRLETQWGKPVFLGHALEVITKSGETRCLKVRATWAELNGRPALIGTAFDVSQTRQKALRWNAIAPLHFGKNSEFSVFSGV